jgi:peroxiredoxin
MATPPTTGDRAIDFTLRSADGILHNSEEARKEGLLAFVFWKKTCGTCQFSFPYLQRFQDLYAGEGFQFWGIAQENEQDVRDFASLYRATFPQLIDENLAATERYDLASVPSIYLTDATGVILEHAPGFSTEIYNRIAQRAAEATGREYVPIVRPEDNAPILKPG